jgi:hypothetical protein
MDDLQAAISHAFDEMVRKAWRQGVKIGMMEGVTMALISKEAISCVVVLPNGTLVSLKEPVRNV